VYKFYAVFILMACVGNAHSDRLTDRFNGNDLKQWMKEQEKIDNNRPDAVAYYAGLYTGYISGVAEGLRGLLFCQPPTSTYGQL
jgi:hypothetical protein